MNDKKVIKDDILEILATPLLGVIPEAEDIIISANRGYPVSYLSNSSVGASYRNMARRINGDFDNMESINQNKGLWNSVKRWIGIDSFSEVIG